MQYRHNSFGKVRERIDQLGEKEVYQYDEEGNLALYTDRDGRQVRRIYNIFGDLVYEKAIGADGEEPCLSTWQYDSLGRLIRAVSGGHSYEYEYDSQGRLKEKRSSGKSLISYTYDKMGQVTETRDPAGICTCYEYDALGRMARIHNGDGLEVNYGYDCLDRLEHISYGNGNRTAKTGSQGFATADFQGFSVSGSQNFATAGSSVLQCRTLDFAYQYDIRGQLLEEQRDGQSVWYTYDAAGNRIKKTEANGGTVYHYNRKNQLTSEEGINGKRQFTYDRQGGITEETGTSGTRRFVYNSGHQQVRVEMENGDVQENRYDTEGLRYELLENGKRTWFVYQNGELLYECGEGEETSYHLGTGAKAFRRSREAYYYHQDEQLNIALITDRRADIRNQYQYDAFGAELEYMEQFTNRLRYTGQQYDQLTGQYYLRARYYNPVLGRFMQEDVYQGDGLNLYAYCKNNPVIYYDPSGFYDKDFFADRITYGDEGKSTDLKLDILKTITGDNTITSATVGSHQAQHLIPGSKTKHPVIALSGYLTNKYGNGIFDRNFSITGNEANTLMNFLAGKNVSQTDINNYIYK